MTIHAIHAREILDSRGIPTIEVGIQLDTGLYVTASVPSGTSVGKHEVKEVRDNDQNRMMGKGVLTAVNNINEIIGPQIIGHDPLQQTDLDQKLINLDGTPDKSKLGGNALLAVSIANIKAGAAGSQLPLYYYIQQKYQLTDNLSLPTPIMNMINGGKHGTGNLDIQEFQIVPVSHTTYPHSLEMGVHIYHLLGNVLKKKGAIYSVGIEGGYAPNLYHNIDAFEILIETLQGSGYQLGQNVFFGIDMSANHLQRGGKYVIKDRNEPYSGKDFLEFYQNLRENYHVISIEDGYAEDDWKNWKQLQEKLGNTTMIIGDDLLTTNKQRVEKAIQEQACNAALIKPNQIGTISETIEVSKIAKEAGFKIAVSHRTGETDDNFIADLAVGVGADYTKFGAPARGERVAKYNRLLEIYEEIEASKRG